MAFKHKKSDVVSLRIQDRWNKTTGALFSTYQNDRDAKVW